MTPRLQQLVTHKLYLQAMEIARDDDAMNGKISFENFCDHLWSLDDVFDGPLTMYAYRDCLRLAWIRFKNTVETEVLP